MKKRAKNILLGSGAALGGLWAAAAASYRLTEKLAGLALDREYPLNTRKSSAKRPGPRSTPEVRDAIERLENGDLETVEITAEDGVPLVGHWYACAQPKRVIVAMHGWRTSWARDFGVIADFWHKNGCCVLYAEQRGQGASGGEYMGFGILERRDCLNWVQWVNQRTGGKLPVYLGGVSMGATTVLMAAGLDLPENVKGVIADCGFTSPQAIWKYVAEKKYHIPYGRFRSGAINGICRQKFKIGDMNYSAADAMRTNKTPVLFVHGAEDHFVPIEMTYENYMACAAPKRLLVIPGAEHAMSYFRDRETYERALTDFWREYDGDSQDQKSAAGTD